MYVTSVGLCFVHLKSMGELDGICTFCEMAVPLVARLAERFGLPGNTPDSVDAARDKHTTRQRMEVSGLPTPRNLLISQPSDVQAAAKHVGFPAGKRLQGGGCPCQLSDWHCHSRTRLGSV